MIGQIWRNCCVTSAIYAKFLCGSISVGFVGRVREVYRSDLWVVFTDLHC